MTVDLKRIEAAIEPLLVQEAAELVDLRYLRENGRWVLRFYIDKTGGITLDDCEQLSYRIGGLLDLQDLIPGSYTLEVSSPGLDRVLKREKDFAKYSGHRAKIRLKLPRDGQRQFRGYIKSASEGQVELENGDVTVKLPLADIDEARLDPEVKI
jgi:ribosome maturation factor RimP